MTDPTSGDVAAVRQLVGDSVTDDDIAAALVANVCTTIVRDPITNLPQRDPLTGENLTTTHPDRFGAAAAIWEQRGYAKAAAEEAGGVAAQLVTQEKNGDVATTYADTTLTSTTTAAGCFAIARRLRRRSCNGAQRIRTRRLAPPGDLRGFPNGSSLGNPFGQSELADDPDDGVATGGLGLP